jgi:hypothetical protein
MAERTVLSWKRCNGAQLVSVDRDSNDGCLEFCNGMIGMFAQVQGA